MPETSPTPVLDRKLAEFRALVDETLRANKSGFFVSDEQLKTIFVNTVAMGMRCGIPAADVGYILTRPRGSHWEFVQGIVSDAGPFRPHVRDWICSALVSASDDSADAVEACRKDVATILGTGPMH